MNTTVYRIESGGTVLFRLLPPSVATSYLFQDSALAISMAAKGVTVPPGEEIRVIHVPTGRVVFHKPGAALLTGDDM